MAIRLTDEFPSKTNPPTTAYPDGSYKNETSPGANDGTPLDERVGDDYEGLKQGLLNKAGITPNGQPDSVTNPQQIQAIEKFIGDGDSQLAGGPIWPLSSQDSAQVGDTIPAGTTSIRLLGGDFGSLTQFWFISDDGSTTEASGNLDSFTLTRSAGVATPYDVTIGGVRYILMSMEVYPEYKISGMYPVADGSPLNGTDNHPIFEASYNIGGTWFIDDGDYYSSQSLNARKPYALIGNNNALTSDFCTIYFPVGVKGLMVTWPGAEYRGFRVMCRNSGDHGAIIDYNPIAGKLLFRLGVSSNVPLGSCEVRDATQMQMLRAEITTSNLQNPGTIASICTFVNRTGGEFDQGESLTNTSTGATGTVYWRSEANSLGYVITSTDPDFIDTTNTAIYETAGGAKTGRIYDPQVGKGGGDIRILDVVVNSGSIGTLDPNTGLSYEVFLPVGEYADAVEVQQKCTITDITTQGFGGNGGTFAGGASGYVGNVNNISINRFRSVNNSGSGQVFIGGDANSIINLKSDNIQNGGFAIVDRSFLGCTHDTSHSSSNSHGDYHLAGGLAKTTSLYNGYQEGSSFRVFWKNKGIMSPINGTVTVQSGSQTNGISRIPRGGNDAGGRNVTGSNDFGFKQDDDGNYPNIFRSPSSYKNKSMMINQSGVQSSSQARLKESWLSFCTDDQSPTYTGINSYPSINYGSLAQGDNRGGQGWQYMACRLRQRKQYILISASVGTNAVLEAETDFDGIINKVIIHSGGQGYNENTVLTANDPNGTGFSADAVIGGNGEIIDVILNNGGSGYTGIDQKEIFRAETRNDVFALIPGLDTRGGVNPIFLGKADALWQEVFAVNTAINPSDERLKTDIKPLSEVEKDVAKEIKSKIGTWKWLDMVKEKGEHARIHVGPGAQTVAEIFRKHGLDPDKYSLFCYDSWDNDIVDEYGNVIEKGEKGDRYSLRYSELLMFIIAAI